MAMSTLTARTNINPQEGIKASVPAVPNAEAFVLVLLRSFFLLVWEKLLGYSGDKQNFSSVITNHF